MENDPVLRLGHEERVSSYAMPRMTSVQIVCGDCAGEEILPRRTVLTAAGRCAKCGGRSYELAARVCAALEVTLLYRRISADLAVRREEEAVAVGRFDYAN